MLFSPKRILKVWKYRAYRNVRDSRRNNKSRLEVALRLKVAAYTGSALALILIGTLAFFLGIHQYWPLQSSNLNLLGDYIGGTVGSLWSLAGLVLIYVAFLGQQLQILNQEKELELNRRELQLTREELRGQRKQLEEQNKTSAVNRFETTFFNLISLHNQNMQSMNIETHHFKLTGQDLPPQMSGRESFAGLLRELSAYFAITSNVGPKVNPKTAMRVAYDMMFKVQISIIGHYFRTLLTIFQFVDDSDVGDKDRYIKVLRSQLSYDELLMLFYNGMSDHGKALKPYLIKYKLFENVETSEVFAPELADFYRTSG